MVLKIEILLAVTPTRCSGMRIEILLGVLRIEILLGVLRIEILLAVTPTRCIKNRNTASSNTN